MILSPRPCAEILPRTRAVLRASPNRSSFPSFESASTRSNSTSAPMSPEIVSTWIVCPGATRYCFPPVSMTAYMTQNTLNLYKPCKLDYGSSDEADPDGLGSTCTHTNTPVVEHDPNPPMILHSPAESSGGCSKLA